MEFVWKKQGKEAVKTDLLVIGIWKGEARGLEGWLQGTLKREDFQGKQGEARLFSTPNSVGSNSLLVVGLGEKKKFQSGVVRQYAAQAVRHGNKIRADKVTLEEISFPKKVTGSDWGEWLAEGVVLGHYSFDRYKSSDPVKKTVKKIEILVRQQNGKLVEKGVARGRTLAEATNLARNLVNTPASDMTPKKMVEEAKKISKLPHLSLKVLDRMGCEKLGMGGFLAVAKGSHEPPFLIHFIYRPSRGARKRIAVVGKGITFDSGGLSLKTAQNMETMKDDMSGAAAVLALMRVLSATSPSIEVHGIAAVTENMPSGSADKPGDIAKTLLGKTIEILNTDAEGRLTLADAIPYAIRQKPDLVIDVATLTGACVVALGESCAGIMGNDPKLIEKIISSSKQADEMLWELPLIEEYREDIKSPIADVKNVGNRWAGAITAGLFLEEFVQPKTPWAHIDIAGPAWTEKGNLLCPKGATGFLVRTLSHFVLSQ